MPNPDEVQLAANAARSLGLQIRTIREVDRGGGVRDGNLLDVKIAEALGALANAVDLLAVRVASLETRRRP